MTAPGESIPRTGPSVRASAGFRALARPLLWGPMAGAHTTSFSLPAGTVTFLLTDLEGSTRLWEEHGERMGAAVRAHYDVLADAVARHGGVRPVEQGEGDSVLAAFSRASDALAAAVDAQRRLLAGVGPDRLVLQVRMALHTAEAQLRDEGNYFGSALSRAARMRALAAGGQVLLSRTAHDLVADRLPQGAALVDLGLHRLRDLGRPEHLFALAHPDLPPPPVALRSLDALRHNLPTQLTSFVGREHELDAVRDALTHTRLLTLTGAGGCGKTRLAAQVAAEALDAFPGGAWWVELGVLDDGEQVERAVAGAVGVRPLPGQTALEAVVAHLAGEAALVVLDNCEHLLSAAAGCAEELLRRCPSATVLATSRAALGLGAETQWRVPSLTLPAERAPEPIEALERSDAVRLFIERALQVRPNFAVGIDNAPAIAQVCHDLDGIPLAIELAAARVRMMSVEAIASGLGDRFRLLTGGARGALPRQQTLRASVDWSHELLDEPERVLLRRLGVFRGGWTLDAAEAVCAGDGLDRLALLDLLSSLVDKSLVDVDEDAPAVRFKFLETVRRYALERLSESGETAVMARRHRDWQIALAERAAERLFAPGGRDWLDALDPEAANLAAALDHAIAHDPALALRLCAALTFWWKLRGHFAAAEGACAGALAAVEPAPSPLRARVLWARAYLACYGGDVETAVASAQEALAMAEELGETAIAARALDVLASLQMFPDPAGARGVARRARDLAKAAGDDWCLCDASQILAYSHLICGETGETTATLDSVLAVIERTGSAEFAAWHWLGHAIALGDTAQTARCRALAERALACADEVGEPVSGDFAVTMLAHLDIRQGRAAEALSELERRIERSVAAGAGLALATLSLYAAEARLALGLAAESEAALTEIVAREADGYAETLAGAHARLAEIALARGDLPRSERHASELSTLAQHIGAPRLRAWAAHLAGRLALADGRPGDAERLLHDALALREGAGHDLAIPDTLEALGEVAAALEAPIEAARLLSAAAAAREQLGIVRVAPDEDQVAAVARRLGETLGDAAYEQARAEGADLGLAEAVAWLRRARGARRRPASGWESLTPVERQVVELAAQGLTNPQIGERLFISRGTVKVHLSHVYAKLGVANRAELAALASRRATVAPSAD
jgi:predicted ATPase/class 3 adenylate cyclase/DNA-binding CsgD family transcriptional regulator